MDDLENKQRWEGAIGKMIMAFCSAELVLLRLYQIHMPKRDYFEDDFDGRFNKVIGALKCRGRSETLIRAFCRLKELSQTRHLIAHSALYFDVFIHDTSEEVLVEQAITDSKDPNRRMVLTELEVEARETESLVAEIYRELSPTLWREEG